MVGCFWAGYHFFPVLQEGDKKCSPRRKGGVMVILWKQLSGGIFDLYEIVQRFIPSSIVILLRTRMDREPAPEMKEEFDRVQQSA
ncbi:hypothetical protein [Methanohalophilus euhalobius]|nr:hypothetical protein [Methanohalophilus euhalobius]